MKIYTAATFSEQKKIRVHKERLVQMGHSVLSTWLEEQLKPEGMTEEQFNLKMAMKDLQEISACDCMILDMEIRSTTMGKMIEFGFALAKYKLIYIVGAPPKNSIFTLLVDRMFSTWGELLDYFDKHHAQKVGAQI